MPSVCLYFQAHQPYRLRRYRIFDLGRSHAYFAEGEGGDDTNSRVIEKVVRSCYEPVATLLLKALETHPGFKLSLSISGTLIEQLRAHAPTTLDSFRRLVRTGRVELLAETYYHSLAFVYSRPEFRRQVRAHHAVIRRTFGVEPRAFRNTELIYNNDVAREARALGYAAVLAEGVPSALGGRTPDRVFASPGPRGARVITRNARLSDDIAFRFSRTDWEEHPLSAEKFAGWITALRGQADVVNLFMDMETFGEHQPAETGIFDFLSALPGEILKEAGNEFLTPSEAARRHRPVATLDLPTYSSWADEERDLSAWMGNPLQEEALRKLYALEGPVLKSKDADLTRDWRRLQTSDHLYYMSTKFLNDGEVHRHFTPYPSPYDAFINFMNVVSDLQARAGVAAEGAAAVEAPAPSRAGRKPRRVITRPRSTARRKA
ncbi:MAG: polysaccharide deacetylase family protein [Nitrospirae bacterium]|nr:polysaccharide deacetylase family protein [Nitrospirota bacterium]